MTSATELPPAERSPPRSAGPILACLAACIVGVWMLALAGDAARHARGLADPLLWIGLIIVVGPVTFRLLSTDAGRRERLALVLMLGTSLYVFKVLNGPIGFGNHDELGQLRTALDIQRTGRLYDPNPVVGAYAVYPGLAAVSQALRSVSGLGFVTSGLVIIGCARLVGAVAVFLLLERASSSARVAGVGAVLYTANPNFVYFDAQVAYESLGLPLALLAIVVAMRWDGRRRRTAVIAAVTLISTFAVVVTHHFSSFFLVATLGAWCLAQPFVGSPGQRTWRRGPWLALLMTLVATVLWTAFVSADLLGSELKGTLSGTLTEVGNLLTGQSAPRRAFSSAGTGHTDPLLERLVGIGSVLLILALLPVGLWLLRRFRRRDAIVVPLLLLALLYPATLVLRLTTAGTETSNRASEYVFLGLGLVIAVAMQRAVMTAERRSAGHRGFRSRTLRTTFSAYIVLVFVGGILVGWAPYARLPSPFVVGGFPNSVSPQGIDAATWARTHLRPRRRIAGDSVSTLLMAAYGLQDPQGGVYRGRYVSDVFISPVLTPPLQRLVDEDKLDYLVVDRRLSRSLPLSGRYFEPGEPQAATRRGPIAAAALSKFDTVPGISRIYSNGPLVVYSTAGLRPRTVRTARR